MADSKGVQDNKCFKEIDLQPIYDRIAELEKKALTLDMIINADGLVTQAHSPIPDEYEIYNQTKDTLLSRTATKAGYFPIGALSVSSASDEYKFQQITNRKVGSCTVNVLFANNNNGRFDSDQPIYYVPAVNVIVLWAKVNS